MKSYKSGIVSVVGGIAVTLITGAISSTPAGLVGATWYGYPTAWLYKLVIAPQYNPWNLNIASLLIDAVFWIAIIAFIISISEKGVPAAPAAPAGRARGRSRR